MNDPFRVKTPLARFPRPAAWAGRIGLSRRNHNKYGSSATRQNMTRGRLIMLALIIVPIGSAIGVIVWTRTPDVQDAVISVHQGAPITEEEARRFGQALEEAFVTGDAKTVDNLLRFPELRERVIDSIRPSPSVRQEILPMRWPASSSFAENIIKNIGAGGDFAFLRERQGERTRQVVCRFVSADDTLNYLEIDIARHPDGSIVADDVYSTILAETLTQNLRRLFVHLVAIYDQPRHLKAGQVQLDDIKNMTRVLTALNKGNLKEALALYPKLHPHFKNEKSLQIMTARAGLHEGGDEGEQLLAAIRTKYPNDIAVDLISINYFQRKKEFIQAYQYIDRVDQAIGGDPYLAHVRGNVMVDEGRYKEAKVEFEKAIEHCPDISFPFWARIELAGFEKNHVETMEWLKKSVIRFDSPIDERSLKEYPKLAAFLDSPQYQELLRWDRDTKKP